MTVNSHKITPTLAAILVLIVSLFMAHSPSKSEGGRTIILAGSEDNKKSTNGKWLNLIYTEAFKRMGMEFEYKGFPSKRSSYMSDGGLVDGEISRVYDYGDKHPDMVRVEEYHYIARFIAFSTNRDLKLAGWQSLVGSGLSAEYRIGVFIAASNLPNVVPSDKLNGARNTDIAMKKIMSGRSDIYVDNELIVNSYLSLLTLEERQKIYNVGVMDEISAHVFLHKKNADIAALLSSTLKQMKQEGLVVKYHAMAKTE